MIAQDTLQLEIKLTKSEDYNNACDIQLNLWHEDYVGWEYKTYHDAGGIACFAVANPACTSWCT